MGSPGSEPGRFSDEGPPHRVTIAQPFAIGRYVVTFTEYDAFCAATGCRPPSDHGWGRGQLPVINVSLSDALAYCAWLSHQTARVYRLPSEAEWEYAARAGTATAFWWGARIDTSLANYGGNSTGVDPGLVNDEEDASDGGNAKEAYRERTLPVERFQPNPFGLYQIHGNVWEYCQDSWHGSYVGAPTDGSAWKTSSNSSGVLRGGSWYCGPTDCRAACRFNFSTRDPEVGDHHERGFRVCCEAPTDIARRQNS